MRESRKLRFQRLIEPRSGKRVDEAAWHEMLAALAPVAPSYLRGLLAEAGVEVDAPWGGVRQHTFDELAESLIAMEREYAAGDAERRELCRRLVIEAKDRARRVAASSASEDTRARKREMAEWMLTWLENPSVFPLWIELRRRK